MNAIFRRHLALPCLAVAVSLAGVAHASTVNGTAFCNIASPVGPTAQGSSYAIQGVTLSDLSAAESTGSQCATFSSNSISYDAGYGNKINTLTGFLTSTIGNTTFSSAPSATQSALGTLLVLTGSTYLTQGESYTLSHDDGVNLYIGTGAPTDLLVSAGYQTIANQSPFVYTGASGEYNFELLYVSNYEAPSELVSSIASTPEPSSFVLLGSGLLGAAGVVRRRLGV